MGWGNSGVSVEVHVPKSLTYEVVAHSSNGRVVVEGLNCLTINGKTANGKVAVRAVTARGVDLSTANGGISVYARGPGECDTSNGTITCCPQPKADMGCRLHTSNGSIRVRTPEGPGTGYRIDAHTSHGVIDVSLHGFEIQEQEKQLGGAPCGSERRLRCPACQACSISARTTNEHPLRAGPQDEEC